MTTSMTCSALAHLEIEGVDVGGEDRDVARAEIGDHFRRMLQRREAEERRRRHAAERPFHRAEALFDLVLALLFGQLLVDESRRATRCAMPMVWPAARPA